MSTKNYVAVCAVAVGKKIINPGDPIPSGVVPAKINAWLGNNSIEEADAPTHTSAAEVTGDGSGQSLPDVSNTEQTAEGIDGENTAIIKRAVSKDDRVIELNALSAAALKKVAGELNVSGAAQMKKEALVEAITAVEFAVSDEE